MLWGIVIAVAVILVVVPVILMLQPRRAHDLGAVSDEWIARHRVDAR